MRDKMVLIAIELMIIVPSLVIGLSCLYPSLNVSSYQYFGQLK